MVKNLLAMNIGIHVCFSILASSGYSGISGSYGRFILSFLRNLHSVLHRGLTWEQPRCPLTDEWIRTCATHM